MMNNYRLDIDFYDTNVVEVAKGLLGKKLIFGHYHGIITETEAYGGSEDEASHAYKGRTKRNSSMFGPSGHIYVYMIYGIHYCLNIVTGKEGEASAVLIRGLKLEDKELDGPGKICKHLGITRQDDGLSLHKFDHVMITEGISVQDIKATPRIGISKATDKLWRFYIYSVNLNN
jgi:DNA-3-methyladenine glycosylase